ncbi:MAG TPA: hypothetical protein VLC10_02620 [Patescibacteria group bacterium]|nr:hypothetical protein [Patescibacteria group bacterium]
MSDSSRRFSKADIDKITFRLSTLDPHQRQLAREHLYRLHDRNEGLFYKESFHRELMEMQHSGELSEIDVHAIQEAFFG